MLKILCWWTDQLAFSATSAVLPLLCRQMTLNRAAQRYALRPLPDLIEHFDTADVDFELDCGEAEFFEVRWVCLRPHDFGFEFGFVFVIGLRLCWSSYSFF